MGCLIGSKFSLRRKDLLFAMAEDIKKLRTLNPEERIKKLKEIEEQDKKEIKEVNKLIEESKAEIVEGVNTMRTMPIPQLKSVDVSTLFGKQSEEERIFSTLRFVTPSVKTEVTDETIEAIISPKESNPENRKEQMTDVVNREYEVSLVRYGAFDSIVERLEYIRKTFKYDPSFTYDKRLYMINQLAVIQQGIEKKRNDLYSESYIMPNASRLVETLRIAEELLRQYRG